MPRDAFLAHGLIDWTSVFTGDSLKVMTLSKEEHLDALVQITAALIVRSASVPSPSRDQLITDAQDYLDAIIRRVDSDAGNVKEREGFGFSTGV
jgi:hypothetical protein